MIAQIPVEPSSGRPGLSIPRLVLGVMVLLSSMAQPGYGAQGQSPDTLPRWEPTPEIALQVLALVAEKWEVAPADLQLEWGRPRNGADLEDLVVKDVLGGGSNGHWVVSFTHSGESGDPLSIPLRTGITSFQPFAVKPLARGDILNPGNMEYRQQIHWGPPEASPQSAESGWIAQRRLEAGDALTTPGVKPPQMVVSGQPVQLLWSSGSLKISMMGRAAGSGALGQRVYVRTEDGHRMSGIVTGPGTVALSNPGTGGEE